MDETRYLILSGLQVACREPREEEEDDRHWIDSTRNEYTGIKGRAFEQSIARNIQIMTQIYKSFMFIDDPAGADKCKRDNPDALIIQLITIDPAICRHRPCKHPACACPQKYLGYALSLGIH